MRPFIATFTEAMVLAALFDREVSPLHYLVSSVSSPLTGRSTAEERLQQRSKRMSGDKETRTFLMASM
jgi:hypothetical protein